MKREYEKVLAGAQADLMLTEEELITVVPVPEWLGQYGVICEPINGKLRIAWPKAATAVTSITGPTMKFDLRELRFRGANGWEGDAIDIMALILGFDRKSAFLALASDASVQPKIHDNTQAAGTRPKKKRLSQANDALSKEGTGFTLADLDLILPDIRWRWEPWLARGVVALLVGEPGVGKSSLALAIAGAVVQGTVWPDRTLSDDDPGLAVWVETESCQALTRERATKWGIPKERLLIPAVSDDPLDKVWLDREEGWQALERETMRDGVELVILDSLRGAYRGDENTSDTIELLGKLAALAQRCQIALLVVHHLRKRGMLDGGKIDLDRVRGSSAIVQIPRCVWAIDRPDPYMPDQVRLQQLKNNLSRFPEPCGFEITEDGVQFTDAPSEPAVETQREKAGDLLLTLLRDGPVLATEIYQEADGAAISKATLKRAKKGMGVVATRKENRWWWALPARE